MEWETASCTAWSTTRLHRSSNPSSPWGTTTCEVSNSSHTNFLKTSPPCPLIYWHWEQQQELQVMPQLWLKLVKCVESTHRRELKLVCKLPVIFFFMHSHLIVTGPGWVWWWWRSASTVGFLPKWMGKCPTLPRAPSWTQRSPVQSGMCPLLFIFSCQCFF